MFNFKNKIDINLLLNMGISGLIKPLSMAISFIYIPIVLKYLGVEKYGIWSTILSILSWISYCDIGISNGLINKLSLYLVKKDTVECKKLISSAYCFLLVIILFVVIIFCILSYFCDWEIVFGVHNFSENLNVIMIICFVILSFCFVLSVNKSIFSAIQKTGLNGVIVFTEQITNLILILIFKNTIKNSLLLVAVIYCFSTLLTHLIFTSLLFYKRKDLLPEIRYFNYEVGKNLTKFGINFFIIQICSLILFSTDNIMISFLYGASAVTPYNTSLKLFTAISNIYIAIIAPIWPAVAKANAEGNYKFIYKLFIEMIIIVLPFILLGIILYYNFNTISYMWIREELSYQNGIIGFSFLYCIIMMLSSLFASVINGVGLVRIAVIVALIQAIINIPLSLLFAIKINLNTSGILIGTILSLTLSVLVFPIYILKYLKCKEN